MGQAQTNSLGDRALWASINGKKDASLGDYQQHTGKVLVSWRMLPGDNADTSFDLYRAIGTGAEKKIATNIRNRTCFQDGSASKTSDNHYRLTYAGSDETLSAFTLTKAQVSGGLPYISIPLADTKDVYANTGKIVYTANDVSVGDLDGDGLDEVMYGSMAVDHDGIGLWNTRLGHGDANHVAWAEAERVQNRPQTTAVTLVTAPAARSTDGIYNLAGQRVDDSYKGIIIKNGKKLYK